MKYLIVFLMIFVPFLLFAKTYKYVDKNGVIVFTDEYESIPEEFKKSAVVIKDDSEKTAQPVKVDDKKVNLPETVKNINTEKTFLVKISDFLNGGVTQKFFISLILLIIFIFAGRFLKNIENKKLVVLIRFGSIVILGLLLFQSYLEKIESKYEELKTDAEKLRTKAVKRGIKADEIAK